MGMRDLMHSGNGYPGNRTKSKDVVDNLIRLP